MLSVSVTVSSRGRGKCKTLKKQTFVVAQVYSLKELEKLGAKKGAQPRDRPVDFIFPNASFYQHIFFGTNREKRRITNT